MSKKITILFGVIVFIMTLVSCNKTNHNHTWTNKIIIKEATCNEKGIVAYSCSECGVSKIEEIAEDETKHVWNSGKIIKEPTIDENGVEKFTCIKCNKTKEECIDKLEPSFLVESKEQQIKLVDSISSTNTMIAKEKICSMIHQMTNSTPRWFLDGDTTAQQIVGLNNITRDLGEHKTEEYYSYTFLIVNTSSSALTIKLNMIYSNVTNNVEQAIRVMTYDNDSETIHIYQMADSQPNKYSYYPTQTLEYFGNHGLVYDEYQTIPGTKNPNNPEYIKYSVFFWLEGQDVDCVEKIYNGTITFTLTCNVEE